MSFCLGTTDIQNTRKLAFKKLVHNYMQAHTDIHPLYIHISRSIIACISPVVPVNCILALAERGYGEDKDMATLLFTAASIDDIHIVSVYAICFAFIFTHGKNHQQRNRDSLSRVERIFFFISLYNTLCTICHIIIIITYKKNSMMMMSCISYASIDSQPMHWWSYVPGSLRDLLMGVSCGTALGLFFVFFPHRRHVREIKK